MPAPHPGQVPPRRHSCSGVSSRVCRRRGGGRAASGHRRRYRHPRHLRARSGRGDALLLPPLSGGGGGLHGARRREPPAFSPEPGGARREEIRKEPKELLDNGRVVDLMGLERWLRRVEAAAERPRLPTLDLFDCAFRALERLRSERASVRRKDKLRAVAEELGHELRVFSSTTFESIPSNLRRANHEEDEFYELQPADYFKLVSHRIAEQSEVLKTRKIREAELAAQRVRMTKIQFLQRRVSCVPGANIFFSYDLPKGLLMRSSFEEKLTSLLDAVASYLS